MDLEERKKKLAVYNQIFENEKVYYSKKKANQRTELDLEKEQFFKNAYVKLKKFIGKVEGKAFLDVGCGKGSLSIYLAKKGGKVIGIDLSSNFIEFCKEEAKKLDLKIDFREMNAQIPDFPDESFDIIIGSRVIHHLPDMHLFFRECKRLLRKNGFITFIEPLRKNPIVELNRKYFAPKERTKHEHPLLFSDLMYAEGVFSNIEHEEFFLLSPLAMFFRRIIKNNSFFNLSYRLLNVVDKYLCKIERLKRYCWQTVFKCIKL
ncbi:MAG: class I SAM-dependent methyltransferase [Candidatus Thorarchaeota archaeon]